MTPILRAAPWVAASLLAAILSIFELIPAAQAATLIAIIPALMVATMRGKPCTRRGRGA